jgi:hypothetical protein
MATSVPSTMPMRNPPEVLTPTPSVVVERRPGAPLPVRAPSKPCVAGREPDAHQRKDRKPDKRWRVPRASVHQADDAPRNEPHRGGEERPRQRTDPESPARFRHRPTGSRLIDAHGNLIPCARDASGQSRSPDPADLADGGMDRNAGDERPGRERMSPAPLSPAGVLMRLAEPSRVPPPNRAGTDGCGCSTGPTLWAGRAGAATPLHNATRQNCRSVLDICARRRLGCSRCR